MKTRMKIRSVRLNQAHVVIRFSDWQKMATLFPDLTYDRIDEWMGHRPATVDSLPVIGISPKADNVFLGYGHQHIGLSGGPKTGRWLAKLVTGAPMNTDLSAYATDRQI
jgi:D-amino-acid dehydrogenase